jgi:hypothetical protein
MQPKRTPEPKIWGCYAVEHPGAAMVLALSKAEASTLCRYWLGWTRVNVIHLPKQMGAFLEAGGAPDRPVVYCGEGGDTWAVVDQRVDQHTEVPA